MGRIANAVVFKWSPRLCVCLAIAVAAGFAGCGPTGPEFYDVEGTVSYQGNPLPLGIVMFVPTDGPPSKPGAIQADGSYKLQAVAGTHRVAVVAIPPSGRPDPTVEGGIDYTGAEPVEPLVPSQYNRHDTSGVEVEVTANGPNKIDINLP